MHEWSKRANSTKIIVVECKLIRPNVGCKSKSYPCTYVCREEPEDHNEVINKSIHIKRTTVCEKRETL